MEHISNAPNPQHILKVKLHLLKHGHIWSWEAIELYDNTRLAACIHVLKKTMSIYTKPVSYKSRFVRYYYDPNGEVGLTNDPAQLELFEVTPSASTF